MDRRTLTMNWDGLGDIDDDDRFFESFDRISSAVSIDLASSGSEDDDEDFDDSRISFASATSSVHSEDFRNLAAISEAEAASSGDYDMWMAAPGSIKERRKRLLQDMGLTGDKELLRITSADFKRAVSRKVVDQSSSVSPLMVTSSSSPSEEESKQLLQQSTSPSPSPLAPIVLVRSRSDGDIEAFSANTKERKEELIGKISKQRLTRTFSTLTPTPCGRICQSDAKHMRVASRVDAAGDEGAASIQKNRALSTIFSNSGFGAFFLIKNLDTGKPKKHPYFFQTILGNEILKPKIKNHRMCSILSSEISPSFSHIRIHQSEF